MRKFIFSILLSYSLLGYSKADLLVGMTSYELHNFSAAYQNLKPFADKHEPIAMYLMGCMYLYGLGVEKNFNQAVFWIERSAEIGYHRAQLTLGYFYDVGEVGFKRDISKAFYWYSKAAQNDNAVAQRNIAVMLRTGEGSEQDLSKSIYWLKRSAKQGYRKAEADLGFMYLKGQGIKINPILAFEWFYRAGKHGDSNAQLVDDL